MRIQIYCVILFLFAYTGFSQSTGSSLEKQEISNEIVEQAESLRREWWLQNAGDLYDAKLAARLMKTLDDWSTSLIVYAPDRAADVVVPNGITQLRLVMLDRVELLQRTILKQEDAHARLKALRLAQHALNTFPWELPTTRRDYVGTGVVLANALVVDKQIITESLSDRINTDGLDHIAESALRGMLDALGVPRADDAGLIDIDERAYETCKIIIERAMNKYSDPHNNDIDEPYDVNEDIWGRIAE